MISRYSSKQGVATLDYHVLIFDLFCPSKAGLWYDIITSFPPETWLSKHQSKILVSNSDPGPKPVTYN